MYEKPKLNRVGEAQDVILGMVPTGDDIDTYYIIETFEYIDDDNESLSRQS